MSHTVLARKWRPKKFADLVGQQSTVTILQNIIATKRLHHAYLLTGTRGVGKTTIARIIAKALNCNELDGNEPCGKCKNCLEIDTGRFIDVIEIDAASNTGVDNIREVLENAQYAPTSGKYKIYIIDEVHMLSKSAFNAMLKTLEEPPQHVVFILATTDPHKVPITILSRCLQLKLRNLAANEIESRLAWVLKEESIGADKEALEILANAANGSMRDALSLTDQAIAFANGTISRVIVQQMLGISDDSSIITILKAINQLDSAQLVSFCQRLNSEGRNLENILQQINQILFQIALLQLSPQPQDKPELLDLAKAISVQDCQLYFEISNIGIEQIAKAPDKYPVFVMTLLRMLAFTIGSQEQKQILVNSNNFKNEVVANNTVVVQESKSEPLNTIPNITPNMVEPIQEVKITPGSEIETSANKQKSAFKEEPSTITPPWEEEAQSLPTPEITHQLEFSGDWVNFVSQIDLSQFKDQAIVVVLRNSELTSYQNSKLALTISDAFRSLVTANCVDIIENLLAEKYNQHFDVEFNFVTATLASYKDHQIKEAEQKQLDAEESIKNDPIIQDLITNFSAKITPNSIKPLE